MNKALKKIKKDIRKAEEAQRVPATRLPVFRPRAAQAEDALLAEPAEQAPAEQTQWSDEIDLLLAMHDVSESKAHELWAMVPAEDRASHGDEYMESLIDAYVQRRAELGGDGDENREDVYDAGLARGQRRFGGVVADVSGAQTGRQAVLLKDTALEKELARRLRRQSVSDQPAPPGIAMARECLAMYSRCPWVTDYDYTLVGFPGKKTYMQYVHSDIPPQDVHGVKMYRPNIAFSALNCNMYSAERTQKGTVLTVYTPKHEKRRFVVAHVRTNGEIAVQDEHVFAAEVSWIRRSRHGRAARMEQILGTALASRGTAVGDARTVVAGRLAALLGDSHVEYAHGIEEGMYTVLDDGFSVRDYLHVAASVLVFLDPLYLGAYAHTFAKRVRERMYIAREVARLDLADKFPEAFLNLSVGKENSEYIRDKIEHAMGEIVAALAAQLYALQNPTERVRQRPDPAVRLQLTVPAAERPCVGAAGLDEWEVVRYVDDGAEYCFAITALIEQFAHGNYTNTLSGRPFDQSFVDMVVATFQTPALAVPVVAADVDIAADEVAAAPDLVALLEDALAQLEQRLASLPADRRPKVCAYCDTYITPRGGVSSLSTADARVLEFCSSACLSKSPA